MDRSAGERRVAAEKDVVGRTVSVKWTLEVPRVAVSWAVPTDKPATVNVTSLELAGTVTLRGAATIAGSALEMRTEVSVVAVLEMATVTVEVVATLKAGVVVVKEEIERAGGGGGGGSGGGGGGGGVTEKEMMPV